MASFDFAAAFRSRQSALGCVVLLMCSMPQSVVAEPGAPSLESRVRGLLVGSLIGDAAGGPVEFRPREELARWVPPAWTWTADETTRQLTSGEWRDQFTLLPYRGIRDDIAPYGPWEASASAGTVTDDSRHKMIFLHALQEAFTRREPLTVRHLAQAYVAFPKRPTLQQHAGYPALAEDSLREYISVARWHLGERDLTRTFPPDRLWAGIATCSGQMTLLPLAAVYPGDPSSAYQAAYAINLVDTGAAKDICAALIAGLAAGLGHASADRDVRWQAVLRAMQETDPYRYRDVPFAKRPTTLWLNFAQDAVKRADGSPGKLFQILENEGRPHYYWDAHFTFATAMACLQFCDYRPRESMLLALAFGHDTDSSAQLIGALAGAVEGEQAFPRSAIAQVQNRLQVDYGESVQDWTALLTRARDRQVYPHPVTFLTE